MSLQKFALAFMSLLLALPSSLRAENALIPQSMALHHGLTRAWFAQVELDRANDHIAFITQHDGMLFVQTSHASVHAIDAETGGKLWAVQIGRRQQISMAPGVNHQDLAVINGSTVFVVDRATGRVKYERLLGSAPGAGPALSKSHLFVPMVNGLVEAYNLEETKNLPWIYRAAGRILVQPIVTEGSIAWTTDKGYFYVGDCNEPQTRFRVETQDEINSRPAYWTPYLYACSQDGKVYAVNEITGQTVWKFPTGRGLSKQPVAVGGLVYIVTDAGGMYCLDGATGYERWFAPTITQFCATNAARVYCLDRLNRLTTLDVASGVRLDVMQLGDIRLKLINQQTDRIYLVSDSGLIQCLHDTSLQKPEIHTPPPLPKKEVDKKSDDKAKLKRLDEAKSKDDAAMEEPVEEPAAEETEPTEEPTMDDAAAEEETPE